MTTPHRYPIGLQSFEKIRQGGYLYVDKTAYVYNMAHGYSDCYFLNRPRRFGKSLLTSTLRCYFEGRRELFRGLAIDSLETEWTCHPVLQFDMSGGKHMTPARLNAYLAAMLEREETRFGLPHAEGAEANVRLIKMVDALCRQTGRKVVVLIDEYDAPLLDVVHYEATLRELRDIMRNFYSPLKMLDAQLRFVFLTGITKFSQLSIFSELNNINNISMVDDYAGICGITADELATVLAPDVDCLARRLGLDAAHTMEQLRRLYDGYHFTWPSPDVFNPFSLLMALARGHLDTYWFETGTPTFLLEMLRRFGIHPSGLDADVQVVASAFDAPTERLTSIIPLLYQSGYNTIKAYDADTSVYTLGIPNAEIRTGLFQSLLTAIASTPEGSEGPVLALMGQHLRQGHIGAALDALNTFLATVPYCDNTRYEGHYQQLLYVVFALLTQHRVSVEQRTARGRTDITIETADRIYVIEL